MRQSLHEGMRLPGNAQRSAVGGRVNWVLGTMFKQFGAGILAGSSFGSNCKRLGTEAGKRKYSHVLHEKHHDVRNVGSALSEEVH